MKVIVLRGVPGSGKSTLIKKRFPSANVVSADHFFTDKEGKYNFDPSKLGQAHGECLKDYIAGCVAASDEMLIVDNTGTTVAEVAPYVAIGQAFGHEVEIWTLECNPEVAASRNIHGVPVHAVKAMHERLVKNTKELPPWWKHLFISEP